MLSTLVASQKQSSSKKGKTIKKSKPTVRHLIIRYLTSTGTTPESSPATKQHPLLNQSSRRLILLTRKSIQNASYTPKKSTQASNAALCAKHSEQPQLLPTKTAKKKSTRIIYPPNEKFSMPATQESHLLGLPPVLHPIKARMGSPEL